MRRARERAAAADLVLWLYDASAGGLPTSKAKENLANTVVWRVANKADLVVYKLWISCESPSSFWISAADGSGVAALLAALTAYAKGYFAAAESALITRARHRQALEDTVAALDRALSRDTRGHVELIAEELRAAAMSLGRLTGRVDVEDILDVIFRDFCIGK